MVRGARYDSLRLKNLFISSEGEKLAVEYDEATDVLTIEGCDYSGGLFRALGAEGFPVGTCVRIAVREGGELTLRKIQDPEEHKCKKSTGTRWLGLLNPTNWF